VEYSHGRSAFSIGYTEARGLLIAHPVFGRYLVRHDGLEVVCAPKIEPPWKWQRFLVGQLLPLVAVLRGLEPLHASAVGVGDRALLFLGASGGGKSSLALELHRRGADFVSDDVAAIGEGPTGVCVHPGAGLVSVGASSVPELTSRLGRNRVDILGEWNGEARIVVQQAPKPLPIKGLFVLVPRFEGTSVIIEQIEAGGLRMLLGATFNAYLRSPDRLERQLEICARVLASAPLFRVDAPRSIGVEGLGDAVATRAGWVLDG